MLHIFHLFNCIRCVDTSCALSSPKNSLEKTKGKKQLHAHFCVQHNKNPNRRWKFDCGQRRGGRHATFGLRQRNLLLHSSQKREEKPRFNIFEHCQYASAAEGEFFLSVNHKRFFLRRTLADPSFPEFTSISPTQKRHKSTRLMIHRKTEEEENSFGAFFNEEYQRQAKYGSPRCKKMKLSSAASVWMVFVSLSSSFSSPLFLFLLAAIQSSLGKGEMAGEEEEDDPKASFFGYPCFPRHVSLH